MMEGKEPSSSSPSESKGSDKPKSQKPKPPSTVSVPTQSSHFLPIEGGEENFAGRQGPSSSSGNSSDNTSEEKNKKRSADNQASASATTSLTDSESSSELPPREKEKRRRIEYLSTAKGGLKSSNDKLVEENKKLRKTIEAIKAQRDKKDE